MSNHYLDDFAPGQRFGGATRIRIEKERIKTFAAEFDPQPFHLDEQAADSSIFGGLAASGWHTPQQRCGFWWRVISSRPAAS